MAISTNHFVVRSFHPRSASQRSPKDTWEMTLPQAELHAFFTMSKVAFLCKLQFYFSLLITVFIDCRTFKIFALRLSLIWELGSLIEGFNTYTILEPVIWTFISFTTITQAFNAFPITSDWKNNNNVNNIKRRKIWNYLLNTSKLLFIQHFCHW